MDEKLYNTPMIQQTYEIKASIEDVWEALTDPSIIQEWSGDIAVMSDIIGATFILFL